MTWAYENAERVPGAQEFFEYDAGGSGDIVDRSWAKEFHGYYIHACTGASRWRCYVVYVNAPDDGPIAYITSHKFDGPRAAMEDGERWVLGELYKQGRIQVVP